MLDNQNYERYHRFAAEEYVLQSGGLLCPQPGCGMGILGKPNLSPKCSNNFFYTFLADPDCTRITCHQCKYVFCRHCLQGFHIGDCDPIETREVGPSGNCDELNCDNRNNGDDASRTTIKVGV